MSDVDPNQYPPNGQPAPLHAQVPPGPNPTAEYPPGQVPPSDVPPGHPSAGEPGNPPRRRRVLIAVAAAVVVIAGAGIGVGVAASGDDSTSSANPPGTPSSTTSGSPVTGNSQNGKTGKKGKLQATRGTITAESGSTWTLKTDQGKTVKVTITADTKFGTKKAPASKTDFTVGKTVDVVGKPGTGTMTANRVRMPVTNPKKPKPGEGSTPAPSSSPS